MGITHVTDGEKRRKKTRAKATEMDGEMIMPLRNHDIFQFKSGREMMRFLKWAEEQDEVCRVEMGRRGRMAVKYK